VPKDNFQTEYLFPEKDIPIIRPRRRSRRSLQTAFSQSSNRTRIPTPSQQEAITTTEGPLLVIAGPGSGKTFTLVERVVHLVREKQLAPENMLVVTFTNKAAHELVSRISTQLEQIQLSFQLDDMYIGTFHSICLSILRKYIDKTPFAKQIVQLDDFAQQYFIYERLEYYEKIADAQHVWARTDSRIDSQSRSVNPIPPEARRWNYAGDIKNWMNRVNEEMIELESLQNSPRPEFRGLADCYRLYRQHLIKANVVDFSSVQAETLRLLEKHHPVLADLQNQIQYIMVDEYQDTSTIQEKLLFTIAGQNQNICVVGDDDQSLYRFRSARVENILDFPNHFLAETCRKIRLETNFRSHPDIIDFYNQWMKKGAWNEDGQTFRYQKEIVPPKEHGFDKQPSVFKISDGEANIPAFLQQLKSKGYIKDWNQVVFLSRSVRDPGVRQLQKSLESAGIGVYAPRARMFFQRTEIQLIIGGLISLFPNFDQLRKWNETGVLEIWEYYDRQCRPLFLAELEKPEYQDLAKWCRQKAQFYQNLETETDITLVKLFYQLLQFDLFNVYLRQTETETERRGAHNLAKMSELLESFERLHRIKFFSPHNLDEQIRSFFNKFMTFLYNDVSEYEDELIVCPSGCVTFMTIHQAKGLEFPVVVLTSLDSLGYPPKVSRLETFVKETYTISKEPEWKVPDFDAWRLFYTAFSRAQEMLVMTWERQPHFQFKTLLDQIPDGTEQPLPKPNRGMKPVEKPNVKYPYTFAEHFNLFSNCPRQYHFFQELNFTRYEKEPWLFGTLVHNTIEDIHQYVLEQQATTNLGATVSRDWLQKRLHHNYEVLKLQKGIELFPRSLERAWEDLCRYIDQEHQYWPLIEWSELNVSKAEGRYILNGKVDLVRRYQDGLEIIDLKTGHLEELELDDEKLDQYRRQLEVYAYLVENQDPQRRSVLQIGLYFTSRKKDPFLIMERKDKVLNMDPFNQMVAQIEARNFDLDQRPEKICETCEMNFYCDALTSCTTIPAE